MARKFFLTKGEGTECTAPSFSHPTRNGPSASRSTRWSAPSVAWVVSHPGHTAWYGGPGCHWHYVILSIGSTSGASVEVSSWSGNPRMCCLCCWATGSIGPVQRPSADSFSIGISPQDGLGSPSHGETLTTNTHHPRSRRLFLGGCLLLSLVVDASHFSLGTVTSEQRASPMSPLGRGNMIRGCL